jgi:hypothetical protein
MKSIAIIVKDNQNPVSKTQMEKIRRTVKKEFPDRRLKMYDADNVERDDENGWPIVTEDDTMIFDTYDVNYHVCATFENFGSSIEPKMAWNIPLN